MLLDIREKVRGSKPIKYTLITLISIPFALVGIGSYFSGGTAASVAEVDGVAIGQQELDRAYNQQRQNLARMFGGELPEGFANEEMLRQQALQQLIEQQVVRSEVENQQLAVGDATLGREIRKLPFFQVDGAFDQETYRAQVRAMGTTVAGFEQQFRDDTALNQFRNGIADTSFRLPAEQQRAAALADQTRTIDYLQFAIADAREGIELNDTDIAAWFEERADQYEFPQRAKLEWLELDRAELAQNITVTDDEMQAWYDDNRSRYMKPAVREASHILISLDDDAAEDDVAAAREQLGELRSRVEAGEAFADLAGEFSDDVGSADAGGSLGAITPGTMVSEFEDALNTLDAEGELSEPVRTEFGVHLIRLDAITPESGQSFADVKDEISQNVATDRAEQEFSELRELLSELAFDNPESLDVAAEETGLAIQESDWVDETTAGDTLASDPAVFQAALSAEVLEEGNNSDIIELGEGRAVVVRVLEHGGPRAKTLDDVRDEVVDAMKNEQAGELLDEQVAEARAALESGASISELAETYEMASVTLDETLARDATTFDRAVINALFALPKPADEASPVVEVATLAAGDRLLYELTGVGSRTDNSDKEPAGDTTEPAATDSPVEPAGADDTGETTIAAPDIGGVEFGALVGSLRDRTDVDLNP